MLAPIIIYATLLIPLSIVSEASLSYLGVGIPPPTADWGSMIAEAQQYYQEAWWFLVFPCLALIITTLAFNILGDGIRDAFDPALHRDPGVIRFLVRRVLLGALVMFCVTVIVYLIFYVGPGPGYVARVLAGREAPPQTVALIARRLLLNRPWYVQYAHFLSQLLQGNLGYDYYHGESVNSVIAQAFPVTLSLAAGAAIIWFTIGVLSGVASAVRPRSLLDRGATFTALVFYSMPTFVLGLLMIEVFYYQLTVHGLRWFPGSGYTSPTQSIFEWFRGLILPWLTLALVSAAAYTRLTRTAMLDVLGEDYIRTARAKGLSEARITFRHALRAALTPVVTQFGIDVGSLLGGAVITENVYGLPGLGYTAVQAISNQDLPVIIGVVIVASAAVVCANIVVDVFYAVLDPRVRLH